MDGKSKENDGRAVEVYLTFKRVKKSKLQNGSGKTEEVAFINVGSQSREISVKTETSGFFEVSQKYRGPFVKNSKKIWFVYFSQEN